MPSITRIRRGDADGNEWDLNALANDAFFSLNDDTSAFDSLIAKLNLKGTGLTVEDLDAYGYAFLGTNKADTVIGLADATGVIATGNGSDDITSGALDHVIFAGNGHDTASGGGGNDIIFGENGKDSLLGNTGNDELHGGNGKDALDGGVGDDSIGGGNGGDALTGGLGDDSLVGGNGDDELTGGEGTDELSGGNDADQFHFHTTAEFGDTITDFQATEDQLVLHVGAEAPDISIGNDDLIVDEGEVVIKTDALVATGDIQAEIDLTVNTTGTLFVFLEDQTDPDPDQAVVYYDADPSTAGDAVLVATLTNITTLEQLEAMSASDFMFV